MLTTLINEILPGMAILSILGYLLSRWTGKTPSGLLQLAEMSKQISGNPNWQLPIVLLGLLISYIANVGAYAVFLVIELVRFVAWLSVWIYNNIILFIYNNLIRQTLILGIRLLVRYCFIIPLKVLVAVVHSVPEAIKWRSLSVAVKTGIVFFLFMSSGHFLAYVINEPTIAYVFTIASIVLLSTYLTGRLVFDNKAAGNKALSFALTVVSIAVAGFILAFLLNLGDALQRSGGILAGIAYAPSVISITATLIACLAALFVSNIGAIYINTVPGQDLISGLKGFVVVIFQRAWYFIFHALFTLMIGSILLLLPYVTGLLSSGFLHDQFVSKQMDSKRTVIQRELDKVIITSQIEQYCASDTSEKSYNEAISKIQKESELQISLEENSRYMAYFSKEMAFIELANPIITIPEHAEYIDGLRKELKQISETFRINRENIKEQLVQLQKQREMIIANYTNPDGSNPYLESIDKQYKNMKLEFDRKCAAYDTVTTTKARAIEYWDKSTPYDASSFVAFLISKTVLWAILLAVIFTLSAFSTNKVFGLYDSSYLAQLIREEQSKSPYQPWAAFLFAFPAYFILISLLSGITVLGLSIPKLDIPNFDYSQSVDTGANMPAEDVSATELMPDPGYEYAAEDINTEYYTDPEIEVAAEAIIDSAIVMPDSDEEMPGGVEGM